MDLDRHIDKVKILRQRRDLLAVLRYAEIDTHSLAAISAARLHGQITDDETIELAIAHRIRHATDGSAR